VVYVPSYNPSTVYGTWPNSAYPPVYLPPPPGEQFTDSFVKGFGYSLGVATTWALFSSIDWDDDDDHHHHDDDYHHGDYSHNGDNININVNNFNHITGENLPGNHVNWQHNPAYRGHVHRIPIIRLLSASIRPTFRRTERDPTCAGRSRSAAPGGDDPAAA
jgi:hypothetical protein